jgi:thiamine biosynthesis lipoprotein
MAAASNKIRTKARRARPLLGTFVEIAAEAASGTALDAAIEAAFADVAEVHRLMSFHEVDSDVGRLNREAHGRPVVVHDWTYQVLQAAIALNRRSAGVFDIAVAPVLQAKGWLPRFDGDAAVAGAPPREGIELLTGSAVRFRDNRVRIDLGGIAKGFAVDRARDALCRHGVTSGIVNAGGDLAVIGNTPQTVYVRDPRDPRRLICSIALANEALASTARRFDPFESAGTDETAVIDPATSSPATALAGVTVRAPSCMIADALTKVVMITGTDAGELLGNYDAGALLISPDGDLQITSNLSESINRAA